MVENKRLWEVFVMTVAASSSVRDPAHWGVCAESELPDLNVPTLSAPLTPCHLHDRTGCMVHKGGRVASPRIDSCP